MSSAMMKRLQRAVRRLVSKITKTKHHQEPKKQREQQGEHEEHEHEQQQQEEEHEEHEEHEDQEEHREHEVEQQQQQQQQKTVCALLEVPVEIALLIAKNLPLHGQLLLSQTCRALRIALHHPLGLDKAKWGSSQSVEFLSCLARQRPDHWACWRCHCLHRTDHADSPASQFRQRRGCKSRSGEIFGPRIGSLFRLYHFHVQLALKYTRLARAGLEDEGGRRQRHLEKILQPYHGGLPTRLPPSLLIWYSIFPRIVDGRFLVLSVWSFEDEDTEVKRQRDVLRFVLPLCPHKNYHDLAWAIRRRKKQLLLDQQFAFCRTGNELAPTSPVRVEVHDACPNCRTDFSVRGSQMCSVLRCWQDLGPEASPRNRVWRARADMLEDNRLPNVYHEPGSVRALYESVDGVLEPEEHEKTTQSTSSVEGKVGA
ncbi:hypothetical protein HRG_004257 [Hirsutella rhossiliensis]|uniref:F-box domain-containing protein n=1 Tax=Hirsutella rhossiliensis TaxID=111463 RepID=A0A9P8SJ40_9HYPO|nr:uncharacterized protein HRG_04257 [Hirsutella rhossiliensis]KAH0963829.1 hypothetical protein HRG_04257 [Hirsutella rhossiliensis]